MAGVGLGQISQKWPDSGFAGAEIRYNLKNNKKAVLLQR